MRSTPPSDRDIVVIGFDGMQSLDVVGPMEVFAVANTFRPAGTPAYRVVLASPDGGQIVSHGGLQLAGAVALQDLPIALDTIVIAGGSEAALRAAVGEHGVLPWLHARVPTTRRVASVCTGAFILAASGLLDGKRLTTHWRLCPLLRELFPKVRVEPDAIFIAEPPFYTSAGVTAGIDLCLALVEADCGSATALAVARELVLYMRRPGGQSQFSTGLQVQANAAPRLQALLAQIHDDPTGDLCGPALAARVHMSERTFLRVFKRDTGYTPAQFVEAARVERAKTLLESSDWPLARVAQRSGFASLDSLHRAFLKRLGTTPGFYRDRFGLRGAGVLSAP